MRRIIIVIFYPILFILFIPYLLIDYIISKFNSRLSRKIAYDFMRFIAITLMKLAGADFHVTGLEHIDNSKNYLFVSNHRSLLDIPALVTFVKQPISFISKIEMAKVPILKKWMLLFKCQFLDRQDNRQAIKVVLQGIKDLKTGNSIAIYPQGTRSYGKEFLPFKSGSFKLATKSGKPIIPVTIKGTGILLEENHNNLHPCKVFISFGAPIETIDLSRAEQIALPKQVSKLIKDTYDQFGDCI